jgi:hypothetical protein
LQNDAKEYDVKTLNSLLNSMSIGNWLRNSRFSDWEVKRDALFDKVKKKCSKMVGLPADKWNPMDIMLIRRGSESEINSRISEAEGEENKDLQLGKINSLFVDDIDKKNSKSLILAISLKEEEAQAGKAKSYVDKLQIPGEKEYNLSEEEKSWIDDPQKLNKEISDIRKSCKSIADGKLSDHFLYKLGGGISDFSGGNPLGKYGSLKMLQFLLEETSPKENIFIDLASYGLSMGSNPTFFKFTGNKDGDDERVDDKIVKFPASGGVNLYDTEKKDYDGKIWIIDNNTNSGIKIIYWVTFSNWIYLVQVLIRSNQPASKPAQVTIEITEFKKLKELND